MTGERQKQITDTAPMLEPTVCDHGLCPVVYWDELPEISCLRGVISWATQKPWSVVLSTIFGKSIKTASLNGTVPGNHGNIDFCAVIFWTGTENQHFHGTTGNQTFPVAYSRGISSVGAPPRALLEKIRELAEYFESRIYLPRARMRCLAHNLPVSTVWHRSQVACCLSMSWAFPKPIYRTKGSTR